MQQIIVVEADDSSRNPKIIVINRRCFHALIDFGFLPA